MMIVGVTQYFGIMPTETVEVAVVRCKYEIKNRVNQAKYDTTN